MSPQAAFVTRLAQAYPNVRASAAAALFLAASRIQRNPQDTADVGAELSDNAGELTWLAINGVLIVNLRPMTDNPEWVRVPHA